MTISIPARSLEPVSAYHYTLQGETGPVPGILLTVGSQTRFLTDADADRLGRYLLFDKAPAEPTAPLEIPEGEDA